ncbi:MAG: hypothetical protein ACKOJF_34200, partial [Planctomycetaceae bacterium]
VAALLGLVMAVAKIDFDRNFRPLLGAGAASLHGCEPEGTTPGTETDGGAGEATRRATRGHFQPTGDDRC